MRKFFAANLGRPGRIVRGILGAAFAIAGLVVLSSGRWYGWAFLATGAFMLFEAARGWCVMRACGIKTMV